MTYTLIIAEKPSASQKIAAALAEGKVETVGKRVRHYTLERGGQKIVVAPAVGHLYGLTTKTKGYPVFEAEWLPSWETSKTSAFTKEYLEHILSLAKGAKEIVAATDFDIEGEVIAANVIEFGIKSKKASRMRFSTLTQDELQESYDGRQPHLDQGMVGAGRTRHYLDFAWGISLSRALMAAIKRAGIFKIMSIGRVQGPALALLAERDNAIAAFKPEPYWELFAKVKGTDFGHTQNPFKDKAVADKARAGTKPEGVVEKVEKKKYHQLQPFPYDLTSLQVDAYRAFGFTPSETLRHAQGLYEGAFISYPRTGSQKLPAKLNLAKILGQVASQQEYAELAKKLIAAKRFTPRDGPKDDPAHPAIHPTGQQPRGASPQEQKLYDMIVRRFMATLAPPAARERQTVDLRLGTEPFRAQGSRTLEPGWMEYFPYAKFEEVELPQFAEGEKVKASKIDLLQKETQPPKRFSPASLVKKLETQGLGTKATRSEIVETLFNRGYVEDKKAIKVTPLGMAVYDGLKRDAPEILSEELTKKFEDEMELIQAGKKEPAEVEAEGREVLVKIAQEMKEKEAEIGKRLLSGLQLTERKASVIGPCPTCKKGNLVIKRSRFGLFVACDQYPACRQTYPIPKGSMIKPTGKACEFCFTPIVTVIRRGRRPFKMCLTVNCKSKEGWGQRKAPEAAQPQPATAQTAQATPAQPAAQAAQMRPPAAQAGTTAAAPAKPAAQPKPAAAAKPAARAPRKRAAKPRAAAAGEGV